MDLIINNKIIDEPIENILNELKREIDGKYLNFIGHKKGSDVTITCPFHRGGQESHPSCHVYADSDNPNIYYGTVHCFTCGKKVPLYTLVGYCFGEDDEFGKQWLVDKYGNTFIEKSTFLPAIELFSKKEPKKYMDESVLNNYNYIHPYMFKRKLTREVISKFKIGYDKDTDCITFPVWDENGKLVTITRRSTTGKKFILEENKDKPVYLLNYIKKENITSVYVCESQINCLTLWTYGIPSVALFGTGSKHQYDILKKSGVRNYILALDGDQAGRKGTLRFINSMPSDIFISVLDVPNGRDINDLSKEEFDRLKIMDIYEWKNKYSKLV